MNQTNECKLAYLCCCRMGAAVGIVWGAGLFLLGLVTMFSQTYGHEVVALLRNVYVGYAPGSFVGALIGGVWGLVDGFIGGAIVVGLYNLMLKCGKGSCCCCKSGSCETEPTARADESQTPSA